MATLSFALCAQAASASNLSYYGGPVAHSMNGVVVDWGSGEQSSFRDESSGDPGLIKYWAGLNGSVGDLGGILAQYMDKGGHNSANRVGYGGQYQITPGNGSPVLSDSDIQNELVSQINGGHLPPVSGDGLSSVYMVLLPPTKEVCDTNLGGCSGVVFCAYHGSVPLTNGSHVLYAVIPESSHPGPGCNRNLAEQTVSFSHEWGETINDPLVAEDTSPNPAPPLAWYDNGNNGGEIGDKCEFGPGGTNGAWTVALLWSNRDSGCLSRESSLRAPTAAFTVGPGASAGNPASFDARGSGDSNSTSATDIGDPGNATYSIGPGIASYVWHWGDGTPDGGGATPIHAFAGQGVYQVTLTVTDNLGFTSSVTQQVSVGRASEPARRPKVRTGAHRVRGVSVTLRARVNARGLATHYHFEFGRTKRYGRSSAQAFVGSGNKAKLVKVKLVGLRAHTVYHYSIVATNARGTSVGADRKFRTGRRLRHARLKLSARAQRLGGAVAHGLRVRLSCSSACDAQAAALRFIGGTAARRVLPVTVARGSAHLDHAGTTTLVLHFTPGAQDLLSAGPAVPLVVAAGTADDQGVASTPTTSTLTLQR
jgi:PKD repeat protein